MYPETSVDFTYITHITLGAIEPVNGSGVDTTFYLDNVNGPQMARNLSSRAHQNGRKAILMLGGSSYLAALRTATNSTNRAAFVTHLLGAMTALGYDGIDVDWEPIQTSDEAQALQFLQALRSARPNMIITFPANWVGAGSTADTWYAQVASVVDQLNLMTYEMAGNWGGWVSWHSAALAGEASNRPSSVSSTVTGFRNAGVPAAKLGIGIGTYGSCWQGVNDMYKTLSGTAGVVAGDNVMTYSAIMSQYYNSANYKWDAAASMGYLAFTSPTGPQQCTLVSYENPQSVTAKGSWAKSQGLGGAIVWSVNEGHLPSAPAGQQDPLLQALYTSIQ
jgi:chitinase